MGDLAGKMAMLKIHKDGLHKPVQNKPNQITVEEHNPTITATEDEHALREDAAQALQAEKEIGVRTALKLYPKAAAWSIFFSVGVIMLAFDPQLLGSLYAMPTFQKDFGEEYEGSVRCHFFSLYWLFRYKTAIKAKCEDGIYDAWEHLGSTNMLST